MARFARTYDQMMVGQKCKQPEEEKGGPYNMGVLARFFCKHHLCFYLSDTGSLVSLSPADVYDRTTSHLNEADYRIKLA